MENKNNVKSGNLWMNIPNNAIVMSIWSCDRAMESVLIISRVLISISTRLFQKKTYEKNTQIDFLPFYHTFFYRCLYRLFASSFLFHVCNQIICWIPITLRHTHTHSHQTIVWICIRFQLNFEFHFVACFVETESTHTHKRLAAFIAAKLSYVLNMTNSSKFDYIHTNQFIWGALSSACVCMCV